MAERSLYGRTPVLVSIAMALAGALIGAVIPTILFIKEAVTAFSMAVLAVVGGVVLVTGIVSLYLRPQLKKESLKEHGITGLPPLAKVIPFPVDRDRHAG